MAAFSFSGARCWSNATIDMRGCCLRKGVVRMAGGETGSQSCCAKRGPDHEIVESVAAAVASFGLAAIARIAAANSPRSPFAVCSK